MILVTGGSGYIGSHTLHHLIHQGVGPEELVVFDNLERGNRRNIPATVALVVGDLRDKNAVQQLFNQYPIHAVIHFAALAYVGESVSQPGLYFENNIQGGLNLLEVMRAHECRHIVFSSTCATYGIPEQMPITEQTPQYPINPYGESKRVFERILHWYDHTHGIKSVILRYFNAAGADYGIGERHVPEPHLIPLAIFAALGRGPALAIFGDDYDTPDGTCIRDYIHVTDLAQAHWLALGHLQSGALSEVFNLGTGTGSSVREVLNAIATMAGSDVPHQISPRRPGDPPRLVADWGKARTILGWKPLRALSTIVEDAWNWHLHVS